MSENDFQRLMIEQFRRQTEVLDKIHEFMGDSRRDRENLHDKLEDHDVILDAHHKRITTLELGDSKKKAREH